MDIDCNRDEAPNHIILDTSVTEDRAVMLLLGWARDCLKFRPPRPDVTDEEWELYESEPELPLTDYLLQEKTSRENDWAEAKSDGLPTEEIEKKRVAMEEWDLMVAKVNIYRCDIHDELNKGDSAKLRIDKSKTTPHCTYITVSSLDEWARAKYGIEVLVRPRPIDRLTEPDAPVIGTTEPWRIAHPNDPVPQQPWYTPARYFARQLVRDDPTLLAKRKELVKKIAVSMFRVGCYKRGGKKPFSPDTIRKALSNVVFG